MIDKSTMNLTEANALIVRANGLVAQIDAIDGRVISTPELSKKARNMIAGLAETLESALAIVYHIEYGITIDESVEADYQSE